MADEIFYEKGSCSNNLKFTDELLKNMINIMIKYGSQDFWKVLKYPSTNSPYENNVTEDERVELVVEGAIKKKPFNNDVTTDAHNELRIFVNSFEGDGIDNYEVRIGFDVICHNNIIQLKNGKTATMVMVHEILDLFNYAKVSKNIDRFTVDGLRGNVTYYNSEYQGYRFYLRGISG